MCRAWSRPGARTPSRTFEILELGADGRYVHAVGATAGRVENVAGCVGLVVDVDAMWAELDRLGDGLGDDDTGG